MKRLMYFVAGAFVALSIQVWAQDWYQASGNPTNRSLLTSSTFRTEFSSIETGISDKLPTLTGNGGEIVAVNSGATALEASGLTHSSGSFTVSWSNACTTTPTQEWFYTQIGNLVTLRVRDDVSCTADSPSFLSTAGDVPAAIRPTASVYFGGSVFVSDAGTDYLGCFRISTAGTIQVYRAASAGAHCETSTWTASGTRTLEDVTNSFSYILN